MRIRQGMCGGFVVTLIAVPGAGIATGKPLIGCFNKRTGAMRASLRRPCTKRERAFRFSLRGARGAPGPAGAAGPNGEPGAAGSAAYTAGGGLLLNGGAFSVDPTLYQRRAGAACPTGQAMTELAQDGTPACTAVGAVSSITASNGITAGASTGAVALSANTAYLQRRVSATCDTSGKSIKQINADGTIGCALLVKAEGNQVDPAGNPAGLTADETVAAVMLTYGMPTTTMIINASMDFYDDANASQQVSCHIETKGDLEAVPTVGSTSGFENFTYTNEDHQLALTGTRYNAPPDAYAVDVICDSGANIRFDKGDITVIAIAG
jgi:hypothetical protein